MISSADPVVVEERMHFEAAERRTIVVLKIYHRLQLDRRVALVSTSRMLTVGNA